MLFHRERSTSNSETSGAIFPALAAAVGICEGPIGCEVLPKCRKPDRCPITRLGLSRAAMELFGYERRFSKRAASSALIPLGCFRVGHGKDFIVQPISAEVSYWLLFEEML